MQQQFTVSETTVNRLESGTYWILSALLGLKTHMIAEASYGKAFLLLKISAMLKDIMGHAHCLLL